MSNNARPGLKPKLTRAVHKSQTLLFREGAVHRAESATISGGWSTAPSQGGPLCRLPISRQMLCE
jgi:hypothetical protein